MNNLSAKEFQLIVTGGVILAANAGFINVVSMAGVFPGVTVSHVTGSVSRIALSLFNEDFETMALVLSIVISYMFGSFIAGYLVGDGKFKITLNYGYALFLESGFLFLSYIFLKQELVLGEWCAAFAMGLQNALCTNFSGLVVRTTHMTGIVTDIGNILGQACRNDTKAELWRLRVHIPLLGGFFFGGILGQLMWNIFREKSLLLPCFSIGIVAAVYLSLPWVKEAAREASKVIQKVGSMTSLLQHHEETTGHINPSTETYQKRLDDDMRELFTEIDLNLAKDSCTGSKHPLSR
jgi:uncharacterized membrane protein YoaK (UPF0700 family)